MSPRAALHFVTKGGPLMFLPSSLPQILVTERPCFLSFTNALLCDIRGTGPIEQSYNLLVKISAIDTYYNPAIWETFIRYFKLSYIFELAFCHD